MAQPIKGRHRGSLVEGIDVAALSEPKMMEVPIFLIFTKISACDFYFAKAHCRQAQQGN